MKRWFSVVHGVLVSFSFQHSVSWHHLTRGSHWGIAQIRLACGDVYGIALIIRWCRRPHCGKQPPGRMVFSCKRMLAKHDEPVREPAASSPPSFCFCSCSDFPQWWTVTRNCKPNDPFPTTSYFWLEYFYHRTERKLEQKLLPEREDVTVIGPAMWPWAVGFFCLRNMDIFWDLSWKSHQVVRT